MQKLTQLQRVIIRKNVICKDDVRNEIKRIKHLTKATKFDLNYLDKLKHKLHIIHNWQQLGVAIGLDKK